jgi:hypothetical protein
VIGQVPEPIGKGNIRGGVAAGGTFFGVSTECEETESPCAVSGINTIEGQGIVDFGIQDSLDLRLRIAGVAGFNTGENGEDAFMIGPGFEFKSTYDSFAILAGMDALIMAVPGYINDCDDNDGEGWCIDPDVNGWLNLSVHVGVVIGIGKPGSLRLLLTPRIGAAATFMMGYSALAVGLDIPLGDHLSLYPQASVDCYFSWDFGGAFCGIGSGIGLLF